MSVQNPATRKPLAQRAGHVGADSGYSSDARHPAIPAELETIVLNAMEKDSAELYTRLLCKTAVFQHQPLAFHLNEPLVHVDD
jgi:hypothetical protein